MTMVKAMLFSGGMSLVSLMLARPFASRIGLVNQPGVAGLKIHRVAVPVIGGLGVVGSAFTATILMGDGWTPTWSPALFLAVAVALGAGLLDDLRALPATLGLLAQLLTSGLVAGGFIAMGGWSEAALGIIGVATTFVVVLGWVNALNLIDGQDGLAGGLAAIAAMGLGVLSSEGSFGRWVAYTLSSALLGFLVMNWPKARVFLGNSGAFGVGVLIAVLSLLVLEENGMRGLVPVALCATPFVFELTFTIARRLASGDRLLEGDRLHSYDLLARRYKREFVTVGFWLGGITTAVLGIAVKDAPLAGQIMSAAAAYAAAASWGYSLWRRYLRLEVTRH